VIWTAPTPIELQAERDKSEPISFWVMERLYPCESGAEIRAVHQA
jgi:hypothetical protein